VGRSPKGAETTGTTPYFELFEVARDASFEAVAGEKLKTAIKAAPRKRVKLTNARGARILNFELFFIFMTS
jgi:hypothetical protein